MNNKKLIPKHQTGNKVDFINTNPLPKPPLNNNPIPKSRKRLQIKPDFKNERPVPGMLPNPRIIGVNNLLFK